MNGNYKRLVGAMALVLTVLFGPIEALSGANAGFLPPFDPARGLVLRGTIVTMDNQHTVLDDGSVLVRDDRTVALWQGEQPPLGTPIGEAEIVDFGPTALIFPGLI